MKNLVERGNEQFIFPLPDQKRYSKDEPITVGSFEAFLHSWQIFSEGSLQEINWDNVVVAGGSVLACISPVPKEFMSSKRSLREYFQQKEYLSSDIDLFLWGLSQSEVCLIIFHTGKLTTIVFLLLQAEQKMIEIYEAVQNCIPHKITCVRTRHAVSLHCKSKSLYTLPL